jgi:hypothetical protein
MMGAAGYSEYEEWSDDDGDVSVLEFELGQEEDTAAEEATGLGVSSGAAVAAWLDWFDPSCTDSLEQGGEGIPGMEAQVIMAY